MKSNVVHVIFCFLATALVTLLRCSLHLFGVSRGLWQKMRSKNASSKMFMVKNRLLRWNMELGNCYHRILLQKLLGSSPFSHDIELLNQMWQCALFCFHQTCRQHISCWVYKKNLLQFDTCWGFDFDHKQFVLHIRLADNARAPGASDRRYICMRTTQTTGHIHVPAEKDTTCE